MKSTLAKKTKIKISELKTMKSSGEKKRVLLVEDDPLVSKAYAYFITKSGYIVDIALNVIEARKRINAHTPNIILLDIIMPGINGFEFLKELKKNIKLQHIPVVMTSNLGESSAIERCKKLGAADYLIKSNFFMKDVLNRIESLIL